MEKGNNQSYFIVYSFMVDELKLSGNELLIYALIYSYTVKSENKCFFGSQKYIGKILNASRQTVNTAIKNLSAKGFIEKKTFNVNNKEAVAYVSKKFTQGVKNLDIGVSNNLTERCQKTLHNNNRNNNINNNINNVKYKDRFISVETFI